MKALGTLKNRYKLNAKTTLCPVTKQDTRWGSVCKMADRAIDLFDILATCGFDRDTMKLFPTYDEREDIIALHRMLKTCQELSVYLQNEDPLKVSMLIVRKAFDKLILEFPSMAKYLAPAAEIVHCPVFDSAVVKIQSGNEDRLTAAEKRAVLFFKLDAPTAAGIEEEKDPDDPEPRFMDGVLKEVDAVRNKIAKKSAYRSLDHVATTSNIVERLFSRAGIIMRPHRRCMDPSTLEIIIMLRMNKDLWSASTIDDIILRAGVDA